MTLAEEILLRIEIYGGREKVLCDIDREWGFFLGGKITTFQRDRGAMPNWSVTDTRYLIKWYHKLTIRKISKRLGRSCPAIYKKVAELNIKKTA